MDSAVARWLRMLCLTAAAAGVIPRPVVTAEEFEPPVLVAAGGRPVQVRGLGHAAPFFGDFDGDGLKDLLVGELLRGRLRIYRNEGTDETPRFARFPEFFAGSVPSG